MFEQVLTPSTQSLFEQLTRFAWIHSFYLAGGTGLALQLGHRLSEDLDWFCASQFDTTQILAALRTMEGSEILNDSPGTVLAKVNGVETSFFRYPYELFLPEAWFKSARLASIRDILCMKMVAIGQRSAKRDYVDIYFGIQNGVSLAQMLADLQAKYSGLDYGEHHLVRSLTYFDEVDKEPMPEMMTEIQWPEIRRRLIEEVRRLERS